MTNDDQIPEYLEEILRERKLDYGWGSLAGILNPREPMDDPSEARDCLLEIREVSDFIQKVMSHCGGGSDAGMDFEEADFRIIGKLTDAIRCGAGYIIEWLERDVLPEFRRTYDERMAKKVSQADIKQ